VNLTEMEWFNSTANSHNKRILQSFSLPKLVSYHTHSRMHGLFGTHAQSELAQTQHSISFHTDSKLSTEISTKNAGVQMIFCAEMSRTDK
jgi:hypothetical protein